MIIKMKNNILVDNINLFDEILSLEDKNISKIEVNGKCKLNIFDLDINKLNILVNDDSSLDINYFNNINKSECLIDIEVKNRSKCILNYSYINKDKYDLKIKTDFLGEEASILINVSALNDGGNTNIDVDGYVKTEKINNYLDENIRIININGGMASGKPNMFIDTYLVVANHNTVIGNINKDELFYLMSKGLSNDKAIKLICDGFIVKTISDKEMIVKIKEYLNGR